jgi:hypothetical protein
VSKKDTFSTVKPSSNMMPTSCALNLQGTCKGIAIVPPHEIDVCHFDLNTSCDELQVDVATPPILEDSVVVAAPPCNQLDDGLSAPIDNISSYVAMGAPIEIIVDENETSNLIVEPDLDPINLVRNYEML